MEEQKYQELEDRASFWLAEQRDAGRRDELARLEAQAHVQDQIRQMREEGKALTLTEEEIEVLQAFRRFKLRMRRHGEVFKWQARLQEGVEVVEDSGLILHPNESDS